jgi:hypothetical protein
MKRYRENILRSTLSYPNETSKECIQFLNKQLDIYIYKYDSGRLGRDRMVFGFTTTYASIAYHH